MKKIIILGGNPETGHIVEIANAMNLYTIVLDPNPKSPSKKFAAKSYDIDVTNLDAVDIIIKNEKVDGVLVGVADPLVNFYHKICKRNDLYCYTNDKSIWALTSKSNFSKKCLEYNISIIPNHNIKYYSEVEIENLDFPVVVKPVDSGAGVGISICQNPIELKNGIFKALEISKSKEVLIEKFMQCDDIFVYYTFVEGQPYISALADRFKTNKQGELSSVCLAAEYPSKYTERFVSLVHPKLIKMFEDLQITNGVLCIQFFVDNDDFYAYDPGFRLQGEAPHLYLKHLNYFDHREMLINFALSGKMYEENFLQLNDFRFKNKFATTLWILLNAGKIGSIRGLELIESHPNVIAVVQRFEVGDLVTSEMIGTERQVFARIYTVSESKAESAELIKFIRRTLFINDDLARDMVLDWH